MKVAIGSWRIHVLAVAILALHCNNYNLYEKLTDPDGTNAAAAGPDIRTVFVSSVATTGDFGGTSFSSAWSGACSGKVGWAMADCACKQMAVAANLPAATYVGWVSTSGDDMTCRIQGQPLTNCTLPFGGPTWVNTMGDTIAEGYAQLFSGTLQNPIRYDETKAGSSSNTWTGTKTGGTADSDHCNAWADGTTGQNGYKGSAIHSDINWTYATPGTCNGILPIYCFGLK